MKKIVVWSLFALALTGCAASNVALLSSGQQIVIDGEKIYVDKGREAGFWAATSDPRFLQANPIISKDRYVRAIEQISRCKVVEAVYDQTVDRVDASVNCNR